MSGDNNKEWKKLTFAQRVGAEPIPTLLAPTEVSQGLRAAIWAVVYSHICDYTDLYGGLVEPWTNMLYRKFIFFDGGMADQYRGDWTAQAEQLRKLFQVGDYLKVYGCLDHFLRDPECPSALGDLLQNALENQLAPYRISDGILVPIASAEQGELLLGAMNELRSAAMSGASAHVKNAIEFLNNGQWAKSIAESIHAVESVARKIEPSASTLDPALKKLAPKIGMHPALRDAFGKLYGYTSDQQGIRHALIDQPTAAVDRDDAIFMLTACAAFSSYLANKARDNNLL
jgi:hypothetical protein